jgi:hypothetical protein
VATDSAGRDEGVAGIVARSVFLGDAAQYYIRSGPIEICAHDRPRTDLAEGQEVWWKVASENCLVLRE